MSAPGPSLQQTLKPQSGPGELLIRVHSITLNPVEALYVFNQIGSTGRAVGSEFAGTVVESKSSNIKPGQRVAGLVQGANSVNDRPGAASKRHFDALLRKDGPYQYDALVDYRDADWAEQVGLHLGRKHKDGTWSSEGVTVDQDMYGAVWEALGVDIQYQNLLVSASGEARSFAVAFYD
ncbi:hypothetical protein B0H63DRAFT_518127 [Podospora didyma]|uniref:Alcohol dehydrogenase-like N-terminal domain-containing protein n=1 Tax=Podospora didyma TaxID=330526 RepID=A0AAE0P897_9PEZI|nr:hypothetical protein B0H63DRAFT_518127 [Podospora didyma]